LRFIGPEVSSIPSLETSFWVVAWANDCSFDSTTSEVIAVESSEEDSVVFFFEFRVTLLSSAGKDFEIPLNVSVLSPSKLFFSLLI